MPYNLSDEKKAEALSFLTSRIRNYELEMQEFKEERLPEYWSRYHGTWSAKDDKDVPWPGSADFCYPITTYTATSTESKVMNALEGGEKLVAITAPTNYNAKESAQRVEDYFNTLFRNYILQSADWREYVQRTIVESTSVLEPYYNKKRVIRKKYSSSKEKNSFIYKTVESMVDAVGKLVKKLVLEKNEKEVGQGPAFNVVPIEHMVFPLYATDTQNVSLIGRAMYIEKHEVMRMAKDLGWTDVDKLKSTVATKGRSDEDKNERQGTSEASVCSDLYKIYKVYAYYDLDGDGNPEDCVAYLSLEDNVLLGIEENDSFYGCRPFIATQCFFVSGKIIGQGYPERLADLQDELSIMHNQIIDNNTKINSTSGTYIPSKLPQRVDKMTLKPNQWIGVTSHDAIQPFKIDQVNTLTPSLEASTLAMAERVAISNDSALGREVNQERPTFKGKLLTAKLYAENFDIILRNFRKSIKELVWQMMGMMYQYMPNELSYGIASYRKTKDEDMDRDTGLSTVTRADLEYMDDFKIDVLADSINAVKGLEQQEAFLVLQMFGQDQSGEINTSEIKRYALSKAAPALAKVVIRGPKEIRQLKEMMDIVKQKEQLVNSRAAMLQQQMGGDGGGQGNVPAPGQPQEQTAESQLAAGNIPAPQEDVMQ